MGLRCTEGRTQTNYRKLEYRDKDLAKLNPILIWEEREIWQYLAMNAIKVNMLYQESYRSLGYCNW
ncbi:phosphoadenosine phosphosulfate reductase family protein [Candidatus Ruthia endofausta]|uniref:Phosphoadenosine phosphosulfate reductase family protein n=1 Tax=Candidatus Ruthia endofausta TaxID=2738852 RepID=A0A6N0HQY6_9GAMM|nr:phosphoadenosine phosphosulfate reductase family protein [Candidatus Ruthia endofausta]